MQQAKSSGGIILSDVAYTYDVFNRRIARIADADGDGPQLADVTRYVFDGEHIWADFDGDGQVVARYLYGDRTDQLLARHRPVEGTAWYLTDHLGTVRDMVSAAGVLINHLEYDSFGQLLSQAAPTVGDRFTYTGRELDFLTGLYYYRARYYDPHDGPLHEPGPDRIRGRRREPLPLRWQQSAELHRPVGQRVVGGVRHEASERPGRPDHRQHGISLFHAGDHSLGSFEGRSRQRSEPP